MPNETPGNGTTAYRLQRLEMVFDKVESCSEDIRRTVDQLVVREEVACAERAKMAARIDALERQVTDLRIEIAKWAGLAALGGAIIGQFIAYAVSQILQ